MNDLGAGDWSDELRVAAATQLSAPLLISKEQSSSNQQQMTLTWTGVTAGTTPGGDILGYVLKVKDCMNGTEWTAFDGVDIATPTQRRTTVTGLIPGREYKATVTAYNLNGAGQTSAEFSFYSCGLPSLMSAPTRITSDLLTMTVGWSAPLVTGGC